MNAPAQEYADRALDWAARFSLTHSHAAAIAESAAPAVNLQLAMQAHIYAMATESWRSHSPANRILPNHIETAIGSAWTEYGSDFMAIAEREYAAALNARAAA